MREREKRQREVRPVSVRHSNLSCGRLLPNAHHAMSCMTCIILLFAEDENDFEFPDFLFVQKI